MTYELTDGVVTVKKDCFGISIADLHNIIDQRVERMDKFTMYNLIRNLNDRNIPFEIEWQISSLYIKYYNYRFEITDLNEEVDEVK